jgi:hypothetical protein
MVLGVEGLSEPPSVLDHVALGVSEARRSRRTAEKSQNPHASKREACGTQTLTTFQTVLHPPFCQRAAKERFTRQEPRSCNEAKVQKPGRPTPLIPLLGCRRKRLDAQYPSAQNAELRTFFLDIPFYRSRPRARPLHFSSVTFGERFRRSISIIVPFEIPLESSKTTSPSPFII